MSFTIPKANSNTGGAIPSGTYGVRLSSMELEHIESGPYGEQDRVKWIFKIERVIDSEADEPEALDGKELWAFTSLSLNIKSYMRGYAAALLGRPIVDGEEVTPADLIGKPAKAVVGPHLKSDGTTVTRLKMLSPVKGKKAVVPVEDDDEPFD